MEQSEWRLIPSFRARFMPCDIIFLGFGQLPVKYVALTQQALRKFVNRVRNPDETPDLSGSGKCHRGAPVPGAAASI
jgi:hypothetical protein